MVLKKKLKIGDVLLKADEFSNELAGGLANDIKVCESEDGYFSAYASVRQITVKPVVAQKIRILLENLTGVKWSIHNAPEKNQVVGFVSKWKQRSYKLKTNTNGQKEFALKIKQTPLGKACDKWLTSRAKMKELKEVNDGHGKAILEEMRKEKKEHITIDSIEFIRKVTPEREVLQVKG